MKVLFAVNNENISESIVKRYQQDYKEIISTKNVYYFNAIIKELQRDKNYDRIVISEDLEPFSNNNYDAIDKFIFEKMDNISDEATNGSGNDIPIILICSDRRAKSEPLLVKLFGIGVYNALIGKDRSITTVCELLNRPRGKKEAKAYYRIDSEDVDYKVENEGDVSEVEIQNILTHYKKLGRNEEKYVESFEHIAEQYTDAQLRLIAKFLPLNVKAVLEANSQTYQEVVSFGRSSTPKQRTQPNYNDYQKTAKVAKEDKHQKNEQPQNRNNMNLDAFEKNLAQNRVTEPVIIPSGINTANVRRSGENQNIDSISNPMYSQTPVQSMQPTQPVQQPAMPSANNQPQEIDDILGEISTPEPMEQSKTPIIEGLEEATQPQNIPMDEAKPVEVAPAVQPRKRGRPRKVQPEAISTLPVGEEPKKRGRGRPRKIQIEESNSINENENKAEQFSTNTTSNAPVNLFELGDEDTENISNAQTSDNTTYSDMILPGLEDESIYAKEEQVEAPIMSQGPTLMGTNPTPIETTPMPTATTSTPIATNPTPTATTQASITTNQTAEPNLVNEPLIEEPIISESQQAPIINPIPNFGTATTQAVQNTEKYNLTNVDLSGLMTRDKKIVAFVGTSKNGTSFLVNNLAEMFSQKGIKTAVLDLTQNRNAYYIYTQNEENLRQVALEAINNLRRGNPVGIQVNKNLTVYTTLPGDNEDSNDYANILETLLKNYSLILLDCDFETNYGYFKEAQEIYLVQSLDILTIQPLTAFLRDLKAKNVLNPEKIRIALNKVVRVRSITERTIVGGMAYYNDPAMSFMTELFNKDRVPYCSIPFEEQAYSRYLEGLVNCKITLNGYSKNFMAALSKLSNMVYPLIGGGNASIQNNYGSYGNTNNNFSSQMNDTLNRMKNNY